MPSLAAKSEAVVAVDPAEMSKAIVVMMEKKIRNLEKRKVKLEDYRSKQSSGLTLNNEQLQAVAKLDDVLSQIELLQELTKQFNAYAADVVKQQKKQQKRERFEQSENERKRFLNVLHLQSVLNALGVEETRAAFAEGSAGAVKLEEKELNHLDELYKIINPERGAEESLVDPLKAASEHLQSLLDAKDRAVNGTTYRELHDLITKIQNCPYFTEKPKSPETPEVADNTDATTEDGYVHINADEVPCADSAEVQSSLPPEVLPEQADVKSSPEQTYEQSTMPHQPVANQPKSIEKIVETVQGQFNFLQESVLEMDAAHADPAVVAVHSMPSQPYPQQPMINHSQHQPENSSYLTMAQGGEDLPPTQHNPHSANVNPSHIKNLPTEAPTQPSTQSVFSSQPEHNFDTGMTFESSTFKQHDKPASSNADYQQRSQGQMRRGGGGYRGGRGNHSNGFGGRGGGYRGPSDRSGGGYRGDKPAGDRGRQHSPSNNGFHSDQRRGGRGAPRGGSGGYRGGSGRGNRGGSRGGFRGGHQQQQQQQQQ